MRTYVFIVTVLLISTICQTTPFLGLILKWRFKSLTSSTFETIRCMACDDLKPPPYSFLDIDKDINDLQQRHNSSSCRGSAKKVVQLLIKKELSVQNYDTSNSGSGIIRELFIKDCALEKEIKTPKAKLVGLVDSVPSFILQGNSKLRWNKNSRTFTANNCIHLEFEGEIFIRKPGFYIVSSTLSVNATHKNNTTATFRHYVNLLSHKFGTTGVLMQRNRSIKESDAGVFTRLLSSVFKLQMYDRISVAVNHPEYIALNSSADNFIAYFTYNLN